jgi:hypothetical protein
MFGRKRYTAVRPLPADFLNPGDLLPVDDAYNLITTLVSLLEAEHSKTVTWTPVEQRHSLNGARIELHVADSVYVVGAASVLQARIPAA